MRQSYCDNILKTSIMIAYVHIGVTMHASALRASLMRVYQGRWEDKSHFLLNIKPITHHKIETTEMAPGKLKRRARQAHSAHDTHTDLQNMT